jgi:hypothetical protein
MMMNAFFVTSCNDQAFILKMNTWTWIQSLQSSS